MARHDHSGRRVPRNAHPITDGIDAGITRRRGVGVSRQHTLTDWMGPKSQNCVYRNSSVMLGDMLPTYRLVVSGSWWGRLVVRGGGNWNLGIWGWGGGCWGFG